MTDYDDLRDDLEPGIEPELLVLADRLRRTRPLPRAAFRGELARHLQDRRRPTLSVVRVRALIASYTVAGTVLLGVGALGAARIGPLG